MHIKNKMFELKKIFKKKYRESYSQGGEDVIIQYLFKYYFGIYKPSYLEIGSFDPIALSNTYLFYKNGSRGICIEPDPVLFNKIKKKRKKDICLNVGVGYNNMKSATLYKMNKGTLNTFSETEADNYAKNSKATVIEKCVIEMININDLLDKYCTTTPNFISLDVEGFDFEILKEFNFDKYQPYVFCVETIDHISGKKNQELIDYMKTKGYFSYADTFINNIFVNENLWKNNNVFFK